MKKFSFFLYIYILCCVKNNISFASSKTILPLKKSVDKLNTVLDSYPQKSDMEIGIKILRLYKEVKNDNLNKNLLKELNNLKLSTTSFSEFEPWIQSLKKLSTIVSLADFHRTFSKLEIFEVKSILQDKLKQQIENYGFNIFLKLCTKELQKKHLLGDDSLKFIESNIEVLLQDHYKNKFIKLIEKSSSLQAMYTSLSSIISNAYFTLKLKPDLYLISKLKKSENLNDYLNKSNVESEYKKKLCLEELEQLSDYIKVNLLRKENDVTTVTHKTLELINFFHSNKNRLSKEESVNKIMSLGKHLAIYHHYDLSRNVYNLALGMDISGEIYYEVVFKILWSHLTQHEYKEAAYLIEQFKLHENIDNLPSNLQFWIALTMEKTTQKKFAIKYYQNIIFKFPLSYYSIMASKKLVGLENSEKLKFNRDLLKEKIINKSTIISTHTRFFTKKFVDSIKRLYVWTKLNEDIFLTLESKSLINLGKSEVYSNLHVSQEIDPKEFKGQIILLTARILSQSSNYLKSFSIIQNALEKNQISLNKDLLITLFPKPYHGQISSLEKDLDSIIILSLIRQESAFNPKARSSAGATGLMQIMLPTAKQITKSVSVSQLQNPETNLQIGIKYFKKLMKKYNGNLIYSLAAYNAGENNLEKWIKNIFTTDSVLHTIESIPYQETKIYVKLIFRNIFFYKTLINDPQDQDGPQISKIFDVSLGPYH